MKTAPQFTVVYEDEDIIAVNKASGLSVGGDRWDESRDRLDKLIGGVVPDLKIYIVHRIDRETSGLVVFARNEAAHRRLSLAFEGREVGKRYIAVVYGRPSWQETACDLPLIPNGNKQHLTIVDKFRGKKSLTRFSLMGSAGNVSILEAFPETGRTHQIRVHAAALGFPVVCDMMYGNGKPVLLSAIKKNWRGDPYDERPLLTRLGLHAAELTLTSHNITAPLPKDMTALVRQIQKIGKLRIPLSDIIRA
ncbi:MAG: RNA pseudouridine synthase [Treponema sp.]|nr:RNA pseudouridine synthase [Treponema sp.]